MKWAKFNGRNRKNEMQRTNWDSDDSNSDEMERTKCNGRSGTAELRLGRLRFGRDGTDEMGPRWPQDVSNMKAPRAQDDPRGLQNESLRSPGWPKDDSNIKGPEPKMTPRWLKKESSRSPRRPQDGSKMIQKFKNQTASNSKQIQSPKLLQSSKLFQSPTFSMCKMISKSNIFWSSKKTWTPNTAKVPANPKIGALVQNENKGLF